MISLIKAGVGSMLIGASVLAAVQPAQARDSSGVAVAVGLIGFGVGAAIASDRPHYREVQYGSGYYDRPQTYYYPQQYGRGYRSDDRLEWQRQRYWEQRRWQEQRRRQWEGDRWQHRQYDDDDGDGY